MRFTKFIYIVLLDSVCVSAFTACMLYIFNWRSRILCWNFVVRARRTKLFAIAMCICLYTLFRASVSGHQELCNQTCITLHTERRQKPWLCIENLCDAVWFARMPAIRGETQAMRFSSLFFVGSCVSGAVNKWSRLTTLPSRRDSNCTLEFKELIGNLVRQLVKNQQDISWLWWAMKYCVV